MKIFKFNFFTILCFVYVKLIVSKEICDENDVGQYLTRCNSQNKRNGKFFYKISSFFLEK